MNFSRSARFFYRADAVAVVQLIVSKQWHKI